MIGRLLQGAALAGLAATGGSLLQLFLLQQPAATCRAEHTCAQLCGGIVAQQVTGSLVPADGWLLQGAAPAGLAASWQPTVWQP